MGREKREISKNGIYHIYFCGINKQKIFSEDSDRVYFLSLLERNKNDFELFAYCLLDSSANFLMKEKDESDISNVMQKVLTTYAAYFNRKYNRSGSLFENRYKSMPVSDDEIFEVVNFIHKLPKNYTTYKWSSFSDSSICDRDFSEKFEEIHKNSPDFGFDLSDKRAVKDKQLLKKLLKLLNGLEIEEISKLPKSERDGVLKMLRENGFTIGQLMRLTGISRSIITRSNAEKKKADNKKEMQVFLL